MKLHLTDFKLAESHEHQPPFSKINVILGAGCFYGMHGMQESYTLIHISASSFFLLYSLSSLKTDYQWTKLGDEGATALADPRVMKNFKTLK